MHRLLYRKLLGCLIVIPLLPAAEPTVADGAVIAALRRAAPAMANAAIVRRMRASDRVDLVLAIASRQPQGARPDGRYWWSLEDRLGLFLQSRSDPGRVDQIAIEPGPNDDCSTRVERMTAQELVLSCVGEKWATYENRKFVYDIGRKALVSYFYYPPYWTAQVLRGRGGAQFVMANNQQLLLVDVDRETGALRVAPAAEAGRVLSQIPMEESRMGERTFHTPVAPPDSVAGFGPGQRFRLSKEKNRYGSEYTVIVERGPNQKSYPLAQSDLRTWQQARPDDAKSFSRPDVAEMNEEIGPHQLEGGRLWFGKTFYNSEGSTGVGGFGYFDAATATYRLYSPREMQRWSVSAILVEAGCIWLALYRRGEYGNSSGGLLRWDRVTAQVRSFAVPEVVTHIATSLTAAVAPTGEVVYLGATDGIVVLRGDRITSYFVDRTAGGRYVMAAH
jgi:hypothetical protein